MELQKEIDPLRLEHNRSMQHQERDREDSQCDAEQEVTKHFEKSLQRAQHPGWSQPQPLHPKPMPIIQTPSASLPIVISHHAAASGGAGSALNQSAYANPNDHQAQQTHSSPQSDAHQPRSNFIYNSLPDRDPMLHDRKPPLNHVQPALHSHGKQFEHQRLHDQQPQHIYMKSMQPDMKHDQVSPDDTRKSMGRGPTKEQMIIQPQPNYLKQKSVPAPKAQQGLRTFRPNSNNDRDMMHSHHIQQEFMMRSSDAALVQQQQQQQQPSTPQMIHQRRINEMPIEMQQAPTAGVIVKRDMHAQHQQIQPPQQPLHSGPLYGNKRNSSYAAVPSVSIHKPTPQSHSPSGRLYEYRQGPLPMVGGQSMGDPKSPAHLMYQSISPQQQQQQQQPMHPAKPIPIPGSVNSATNQAMMVQPNSRHPNIASPPINKAKVSAPAPTHIYGKPTSNPIELNAPGICSGIPVCQSRRESPSKATYTPSPIGLSPSPLLSSSSPAMNVPPPAHLSRPLNDVRHFSSRHPIHASSPPPTGPQSPSPSLLIQKTTTISPLTSPMLHGPPLPTNHSVHIIASAGGGGGSSSPSSFQTQPLDLGVSNRADHHYNPKRKATHGLSSSTEALDIRKKRTEPSPPVHHPHIESPTVMFTGGGGGGGDRMSPSTYRSPNSMPDNRRPMAAGGAPPAPASNLLVGHYDPMSGTPQTVYVPLAVGSHRPNYPKTGEANAPKALITYTNSASTTAESIPTNSTTTLPTRYSNNISNNNNNNNNSNNIETNARLPTATAAAAAPVLMIGLPTATSPTPLTTISKEQRTTTEVPPSTPQPVAPEHDKPVVNQSTAPPRHLKKAWLQRHTGEDSESNTDKGISAATKPPLVSSPSPVPTTATTPSPAPSATPTPPPTTPTATQPPPIVSSSAVAPLVHSSSSNPSTTSSLSSPSTASSTPPPHPPQSPILVANSAPPPSTLASTQHTNNNNNSSNATNHATPLAPSTPPRSSAAAACNNTTESKSIIRP